MTRFARFLPARPHLDPLRRQARRLQRDFATADETARARVAEALPRRATAPSLALADAQAVIAREYGFTSWPRLKLFVEAGADPVNLAFTTTRLGDSERLRALLATDATLIGRADGDGYSLLHHACSGSARRNRLRVEVARVLLDAGADVEATTPDGSTPLHFAAQCELPELCALLLDRGADPTRTVPDGATPLLFALFYGNPKAAELLAARGPVDDDLRSAAGLGRDVERHLAAEGGVLPSGLRRRAWRHPHWFPRRPLTADPAEALAEALEWAVGNRRLEAARRLVQAGARFDAHAATKVATGGDGELVALLLSMEPDLAAPIEWDWPIWQWANFAGHEALAVRLKREAAPKHLPTAADLGRLDLVDALLAAGADPSQQNHEGTSALGLALGSRSLMSLPGDGGSPEVAARLKTAGARLDFCSAARFGRLEEVERHLRDGADPARALHAAVEARQLAVIERLAAAGAPVDIFVAARLGRTAEVLARLPGHDWLARSGGDTVLDKAIDASATDLVRALLERGAPVCAPGYGEIFGRAAVHVAAWAGADAEIWDLLLAHGADINHASDPGTPYDCARMAHHPETMALIRERGGLPSAELEVEG